MNKVELVLQESEKAFLLEKTRAAKLGEAAEKLIGAVAVVVGFQLIEFDHLALSGDWQEALHNWIAVGAFIALGGSLVLTLLSMRVQEYYSYPRGTELIDELKAESITDEVAMIKIARMYLTLHDKNARVNDERAKLVYFSGILLVTGFGLAVASYLATKMI